MNYTNVTVENCIEMLQAKADELFKNPDQVITNDIMAIRLLSIVNEIADLELAAKKVEIENLKSQIASLR